MKIDCAYDELVELNKLTPNPKNNNKHTSEQIKRLSKIIDYQGMRSPVVVSKRSGFIIKGHCRLEAVKLLKWETVPVNFQDYESEAQEYADMTADNEIARWAELDLSDLHKSLGDLEFDLDLDLLGIRDLTLPETEVVPECDEDDVPEVKEDPITKRGDVWLLGEHRVMCGDSTMIDDVEKLMNGKKADMVFTDPPYGMNLDTDYSGIKGSKTDNTGFQKRKGDSVALKHRPVLGDSEYFDPSFLFELFKPKEMFLWGADYYCWDLPRDGSWIVWDKTGGNDSLLSAGFGSNFELCWSFNSHKRDIARITYKGMAGHNDGKRVHPTQKPIALALWFFEKWGKDYSVLDLFLGSGSTLIACEKTKRKCYGMELDEHYCDVIINRWQKYTGKEAVLESNNKKYNELKSEVQ